MTILAFVSVLSLAGQTPATATIRLTSDRFLVSAGAAKDEVRLAEPEAKSPDHLLFRSDKTFVAWDKRGLTIRTGRRTLTTQLKEIPVSPRLRTRDAIRATLAEVRAKRRSLDADAVSGSRRVGKDVYFVVRWEDGPGKTWLEALVDVNLGSSKPEPHALAVLPGLSFSTGLISDNLVATPASLRILLHNGPAWGVWNYPLDGSSPTFKPIGDGVKYAAPFAPERACYVEKTSGGTFVAGTVDLDTGVRSDTDESQSQWHMAEAGDPPLAEADDTQRGRSLLNVTTGAELSLPEGAEFRRSKAGLLVWVGGKRPSKAWLYDPTDWTPLAWWRTPTPHHSTRRR